MLVKALNLTLEDVESYLIEEREVSDFDSMLKDIEALRLALRLEGSLPDYLDRIDVLHIVSGYDLDIISNKIYDHYTTTRYRIVLNLKDCKYATSYKDEETIKELFANIELENVLNCEVFECK